jgi:hypothetical protein
MQRENVVALNIPTTVVKDPWRRNAEMALLVLREMLGQPILIAHNAMMRGRTRGSAASLTAQSIGSNVSLHALLNAANPLACIIIHG